MKGFHKQMIDKQGELATVDKTIQELQELQEKLRDWKSLYFAGNGSNNSSYFRDCMEDIQEERVDVSVMLNRIDKLFNFTKQDNKNIAVVKINRTIERYLL